MKIIGLFLLCLLCRMSSARWNPNNAVHSSATALPHPAKVIYIDYRGIDWNHPENMVYDAVNAGFNVLILSFWLDPQANPADAAYEWGTLTPDVQAAAIQFAHSKGAVVMVSAGGSTVSPFQYDPTTYGTGVANWAKKNQLDGVDFDMENIDPGFKYQGMTAEQVVAWLVTVSKVAKNIMGSGSLISHAPQAPYFGPFGNSQLWTGVTGGYTGVYANASREIDFFNVQFYNQGGNMYVTYNNLFLNSSGVFPGTAMREIQSYGIPLSKLVCGKYIPGAASNGYVDAATLKKYFDQANSGFGWSTGVMFWLWDGVNGDAAQMIQTIYGK